MKNSLIKLLGASLLLVSSAYAYHGEDKDPFSIQMWGYMVDDAEVKVNKDPFRAERILLEERARILDPHGRPLEVSDSFSSSSETGRRLRGSGSKMQFGEAHLNLDYTFSCNTGCCENYIMGVGYTYTRMHWSLNPIFTQSDFNALNVDLGATFGCICDWTVRVFTRTYLDTDSPNPSHYLWWDLMVWGRLKHKENIGIHLGLLDYTGMKVNRMYPILGIDWRPIPELQLNMVFPTNMSAVWAFNDQFRVSFGGRLLYSRYRIREVDTLEDLSSSFLNGESSSANSFPIPRPFPKIPHFLVLLGPDEYARAVWEYRAVGLQVSADYDCGGYFLVNLHVGWAWDAHLTIGAHSFNHKLTYHMRSAPYAGAQVNFRF